jgi:two-component system sensor histidine kinase HydH
MSALEPRPLVLACEDEEPIVEFLRTLTEPLGVDLIAAKDGAETLAYLSDKRPALMTLDLVLPDIDGLVLLERIRQIREHDDMPVMVVSALSDTGTVKRAYHLGAADFVVKPFNIDLLEAKLKVFLRMRQLSDRIQRREQFLQEVVEHLSSGLMVADKEGVILQVNAAGAASVSQSPAALIGRRVKDALPGAEAMFRPAGDTAQRRVTILTIHGPRLLGFTNTAVEVEGRTAVAAVFRELASVEAARRERDDRALKEELASSAKSFAHEVRNPLAAIGAAAQVIARDSCEKPQRLRLCKAIEGEATRISGLLQEYVERRQAPTLPGEVDVSALLQEVVEVNLLGSAARPRISISCDGTLPSVRADGARLKQVVLNLVLNAIKATDHGGSIRLVVQPESGGVALRVADTGCGIAEDDLPRIFEETYSTRQGGGLGLPITRRIVEAHGGAIRVESKAGTGTTFTVWLPAG